MSARLNGWVAIAAVASATTFGCSSKGHTKHMRQSGSDAHSMRSHGSAAPQVKEAVAVMRPVGDSGVSGTVNLRETPDGLKITGEIRGLDPGRHGFHVHQYGDLSDTDKGESAGGHFNPDDEPHGRPNDKQRHTGDFGNIEANDQGVARIDYTDSVASLNGPCSILGRALVIHKENDKFTQPSGDAGTRVAFGVIGVAQKGQTSAAPPPSNYRDSRLVLAQANIASK